MSKLLTLPFKLVFRFLRLSGVKGSLLLGLGVAIGVLAAPQKGSVLRARLKAKMSEGRNGAGAELPADVDLTL